MALHIFSGMVNGKSLVLAALMAVFATAGWTAESPPTWGDMAVRTGVVTGLLAVIIYYFTKRFGGLGIITDALPRRAWAMIIVLVLIAASRPFLVGADPNLTIERSLTWLFCLFLGLLLFRVFQVLSPRAVLAIVMGILIGLSVAYIAVTAFTYITSGAPAGEACERQVLLFGNVRYTGYFVGPALGMAIFAAVSREFGWLIRSIGAVTAVILWAYLEYTGSRGAVFALLAALLGGALFFAWSTTFRLLICGVVTCVIALGIMQLVPPAECHVFGLFLRTVQSFETGRITTGRTDIWAYGWELFLQRPIFGHGDFRLHEISDLEVTQFHNVVLQSLVNWGAVGAVIFLSLGAELVIRIIVALRDGPWQIGLILFALFVILGYSLIDATLYYAFPLVLTAILLSAAFAMIKPRPVV